MSNTSKERGKKGSKFWIQDLVNDDNGVKLTNRIKEIDSSISDIEWLSPLKKDQYKEFSTGNIEMIKKLDLKFWPNNGPSWDAVGIDGNTIILVEAKAHTSETRTRCSATSIKSIELIKKSMREAHDKLAPKHNYNEEVWYNKYYQLGNRITFLEKLKENGLKVKLVLLNIVDDTTYIKTTENEWNEHYKEVFTELLGGVNNINDVIIVNFQV